jgi:predicted RND superfamily exporter protein
MIDYLYYDALELSTSKLARIEKITLSDFTLLDRLISADGPSTGINVRAVLSAGNSMITSKETVNAAWDLAKIIRPHFPSFDMLVGESLASNVTMGEAVEQDIKHLLGLSYVVMIITMMILLRSFSSIFLTLMVITFSVVSTMGLFGWRGFTMPPPTVFVPTAILTIAVANPLNKNTITERWHAFFDTSFEVRNTIEATSDT